MLPTKNQCFSFGKWQLIVKHENRLLLLRSYFKISAEMVQCLHT